MKQPVVMKDSGDEMLISLRKLFHLQETKYNLMRSLGLISLHTIAQDIASVERDIHDIHKKFSSYPDKGSSDISETPHGIKSGTSSDTRLDTRLALSQSATPTRKDLSRKISSDIFHFNIIESSISNVNHSDISTTLPAEVLWSYPGNSSSLSISGIQNFCFPKGISFEYVSKEIGLNLISSAFDERHILQFMDSEGNSSHACCLIVNVALESPSMDISRVLLMINRKKRSARRLTRVICDYAARRRRSKWQLIDSSSHTVLENIQSSPTAPAQHSKSSLFSRAFGNRQETMSDHSVHSTGSNPSSSPRPLGSRLSLTPSGSQSTRSAISSTNSVNGNSSNGNNNINPKTGFFSKIFAFHRGGRDPSNSSSGMNNSTIIDDGDETTSVSSTTPKIESFDNDNEDDSSVEEKVTSDRCASPFDYDSADSPFRHLFLPVDVMDEIIVGKVHQKFCIVSKRAYCIITKDPQHAQVFKILEAMANAERKLSMESLARDIRDDITTSTDFFAMCDHIEKSRLEFLQHIARVLPLFPSPSTSTLSPSKAKSEVEVAIQDAGKISIAGYIHNLDLSMERGCPSLREWTLAVLLCYFNPTTITKILNILLVEKSLIIYGQQPGVVTAISLAVAALLAPFAWEGVFVPLVPEDAREVFEAPVPFIVGTISLPNFAVLASSVAVLVLEEEELLIEEEVHDDSDGEEDEDKKSANNVDVKVVVDQNNLEKIDQNHQHDTPSTDDSAVISSDKETSSAENQTAVVDDNGTKPQTMKSSDKKAVKKSSSKSNRSKYDLGRRFSAWFSRLPDISADIHVEESVEHRIDSLRSGILKCLARHRQPARYSARYGGRSHFQHRISTPDVAFLSAMSQEERAIVAELSRIVLENNQRYCGDLMKRGSWKKYARKAKNNNDEMDGWPQSFSTPSKEDGSNYGEKEREFSMEGTPGSHFFNLTNRSLSRHSSSQLSMVIGGGYESSSLSAYSNLQFQPELFLEPMRCLLEFQTAVAHTQYFIGYFEGQKKLQLENEIRQRLFLCEWIAYKLYLRKKRKEKREEEDDEEQQQQQQPCQVGDE